MTDVGRRSVAHGLDVRHRAPSAAEQQRVVGAHWDFEVDMSEVVLVGVMPLARRPDMKHGDALNRVGAVDCRARIASALASWWEVAHPSIVAGAA